MTPQEQLERWREPIDAERRKEVYESLLGHEDFGDFLNILRDMQDAALGDAQATRGLEPNSFDLGRAQMIDDIKQDILANLRYTQRRM